MLKEKILQEEVEVCPHCMGENIIQWNVGRDGYEINCQHCGKRIMLCDACLHSDDNELRKCDWNENDGCFRKKDQGVSGNILIWNEDIGFVRINEGTGENLLPEDEEQGYVDYVMLSFLEYDGYDFEETDGVQVMLTELYQEKFKTIEEVIQYLIEMNWIPDYKYQILYGE